MISNLLSSKRLFMRKSLYIFFSVCFVLFSMSRAYSGSVEITQPKEKALFASGTTVKVEDPFYRAFYGQVNYSSKVSLVYGREQKTDIVSQDDWKLTVKYSMTFYDDNDVQMGAPISGNTLIIYFNKSNP